MPFVERHYSLMQLKLDPNIAGLAIAFACHKSQRVSSSVKRVFFFLIFSHCSNRRDEYDI